MTKDEYKNQRESLLGQVKEAQTSGDASKMNAIMDQVEQLDDAFHQKAVNAANERAMGTEALAIDFKNMSQPVAGGKVVETMENTKTAIVYTAESKEYHDGFLKKLQGKALNDAEMKATAVVAPGTIPTETVNKIFGKLQDAPLLGNINLMMIPGNVSIPVEETCNDANWVDMGTAANDSNDSVITKDLGAYKLIKTVEITADLSRMAIPAFEAWLVERLARKIRNAADKAVCVGTGSSQATGMLHASEITNEVQFTSGGMKYDDLLKIIAALPAQYLSNAKFAMPSALFFSDVLGMKDAAGKPVVVADVQGPAKYNVLGYPVLLDDNITADNLVFGDLYEGYTMNFAMAPTVDRDESVGFRTGSTVFRGMALADGKVIDKNALVKASRSA